MLTEIVQKTVALGAARVRKSEIIEGLVAGADTDQQVIVTIERVDGRNASDHGMTREGIAIQEI